MANTHNNPHTRIPPAPLLQCPAYSIARCLRRPVLVTCATAYPTQHCYNTLDEHAWTGDKRQLKHSRSH